jgi:hypothetical protein
LAVLGHDGASHDFVGEVDAEGVGLRGHGEEKLGDVVGVEGGGLGGEAGREVSVS